MAKKPAEPGRFTFLLPASLAVWVHAECARTGVSSRQLIRLALTAYKLKNEPEAAPKKKKPAGKQAKRAEYLAAVRDVFGPHLAAERVGVSSLEVDQWAEDENFAREFEAAQMAWLELLEQALADVGRGAAKGNASALTAVLAARHPDYGRIKLEQLLRLVGPTFEDIYDAVREMAGDKLGESIVKKLREIADRRFSNLTN